MLILHTELLRRRLVLVAARRKTCIVCWCAIIRILCISCAACGITLPFFDL
jgi:hypothetical protein